MNSVERRSRTDRGSPCGSTRFSLRLRLAASMALLAGFADTRLPSLRVSGDVIGSALTHQALCRRPSRLQCRALSALVLVVRFGRESCAHRRRSSQAVARSRRTWMVVEDDNDTAAGVRHKSCQCQSVADQATRSNHSHSITCPFSHPPDSRQASSKGTTLDHTNPLGTTLRYASHPQRRVAFRSNIYRVTSRTPSTSHFHSPHHHGL